ncbi:MAG TPA: polysulfide reductase NrfD [Verrucomicrobiae bacterium]|nr:polysulfide reductase NrfD [Verrucomicrobiae bacterium]
MADAILNPPVAHPDAHLVARQPLVLNRRPMAWITEHVARIVEDKSKMWWWISILITGAIASLVPIELTYLVSTGVGVWGLNHPVGWAWDITNFVFWIGIGHAGTLISAILFLTRQRWRTSINRSAEAMTIFAVICAGIFPAFHVGRLWMVWFLAPVPNANVIWPNFKSPLLWDVFAVSTYFTVSLIFWYVGLIPDFATIRDRARDPIRKFIYGLLALGWRGSNRQWSHYEKAYLVLAGISTPLVLSVHSVVSFDFATSVIPGWHTTIFPPYFVAGAIFGGFAMVLTLLVPCRWLFGLQDLITTKHIDNMCKIVLLTGTIVGYAYMMELFIAWYSGNPYEWHAFLRNRIADPYIIGPATGVPPAPYWWAYWTMMTCNVLAPQLFWFKPCRQKAWIVWIIVCFGPNVGMWFERFVIIVTSLHRDFMPGAWGYFVPTINDILLFSGTVGLFVFLFLLFVRFFPMITMFEVKAVLPEADPHHLPEPRPPQGHNGGAIQGEVREILARREAKARGGHA